jgi:hypothetical protein
VHSTQAQKRTHVCSVEWLHAECVWCSALQNGCVLSVSGAERLQELFGLSKLPALAGEAPVVPVTVQWEGHTVRSRVQIEAIPHLQRAAHDVILIWSAIDCSLLRAHGHVDGAGAAARVQSGVAKLPALNSGGSTKLGPRRRWKMSITRR